MTDWRARADELLAEFDLCWKARPRQNTVDIQLAKDECAKWAYHLNAQKSWGTDLEIAEAYYQLEPKLKELKQQVIIEILTHGTV
jgi:hypothetical protein